MIFQYAANCQTTTVLSGSVNREDGQPVAGAMISLLNTNFSVYAGNDGNFTIEEVPAGGYILQISAPGYANVHRNIQVPSGSLEIRLVRSSEQLDAITVTRSEEQTSELQSLKRISYAVFCL